MSPRTWPKNVSADTYAIHGIQTSGSTVTTFYESRTYTVDFAYSWPCWAPRLSWKHTCNPVSHPIPPGVRLCKPRRRDHMHDHCQQRRHKRRAFIQALRSKT